MRWYFALIIAHLFIFGCHDNEDRLSMATGVFAPMGDIRPDATEEERALFEEGLAVAIHRFTAEEGLGPYFNVTFCGGCHEKPDFGGSAGHYRDFYIYGETLQSGAFSPSGPRSGVLTTFSNAKFDTEEEADESQFTPTTKVDPEQAATLYTIRNPIPFFGIGLLAEVPEAEILSRADPDDQDGDGISGRPNYDQGYVGRFGLKAQTVSIENFIRGPLFNHLGITSDPLSPAKQAQLPVPSVAEDRFDVAEQALEVQLLHLENGEIPLDVRRYAQSAAPSEPLTDEDEVPDPELSEDDLFALVSWAMLLAAPLPGVPDTLGERGEGLFHAMQCAQCHTPALKGPRGLIPAYSDLLLHDMGDELADGIVMALAGGSEFRTQPLWGITATGPYLHDGRAGTLDEAIVMHGGEAEGSRNLYVNAEVEDRDALIAFLESLGGLDQQSGGLLPPNSPLAQIRGLGRPRNELNADELALFLRGRARYDRDVSEGEGLGPSINGDSCRGCHFEPGIGGAGPSGVSAVRLVNPTEMPLQGHDGQVIKRFTFHNHPPTSSHSNEQTMYEVRQALPSYGLGILDEIPDEAIIENADPDDDNEDGIRGQVRVDQNGRVGRFGWRAQLPTLTEFVADALSVELGLTLPVELGLEAAEYEDQDAVPDPEIDLEEFSALVFYLRELAPPEVIVEVGREQDVELGRRLFIEAQCAACHIPKLTDDQSYEAYTDLLLHQVQDTDIGSERSFRTPPLWGVGDTGSYWHDGRATTLWDAILLHGGEAKRSKTLATDLSMEEREALIYFIQSR